MIVYDNNEDWALVSRAFIHLSCPILVQSGNISYSLTVLKRFSIVFRIHSILYWTGLWMHPFYTEPVYGCVHFILKRFMDASILYWTGLWMRPFYTEPVYGCVYFILNRFMDASILYWTGLWMRPFYTEPGYGCVHIRNCTRNFKWLGMLRWQYPIHNFTLEVSA